MRSQGSASTSVVSQATSAGKDALFFYLYGSTEKKQGEAISGKPTTED
jgi:hypothetical protein